jgi:hypothetical protein
VSNLHLHLAQYFGGTKKWGIGTLSLIFLLSSLSVNAAEAPVGTIKITKGAASIIREDKAIPAKIGEKVFVKDALKTGPDGSLGMTFKDDTLLSIGPNSEVLIDEFLFSPAENKLSIVTKLFRGTAAYLTGTIGKLSPESVRFETPVANVGIRGTKFAVKIEEGGTRSH